MSPVLICILFLALATTSFPRLAEASDHNRTNATTVAPTPLILTAAPTVQHAPTERPTIRPQRETDSPTAALNQTETFVPSLGPNITKTPTHAETNATITQAPSASKIILVGTNNVSANNSSTGDQSN